MKRFSKALFLTGLGILTAGAVAYAAARSGGAWEIKKIKGSTIYFKNGEQLSTRLYDIRYIGKIDLKSNSPLYIFSGSSCKDCDEHNSIFLFSPAENKKTVTPEYAPYDYPGKEYSSEDSSLLYQTRMFYGQVLPNVTNGIIWYQEMLGDDGHMMKSAYLIKVNNNRVSEELILNDIPSIEDTLKLVQANRAKELQGVDAVVEP